MKAIKAVGLMLALALGATSAYAGDVWVKPHVRRDGTFVEGHHRSAPNSIRSDNYSSRGNTNPYTNERGSQRNEFTDPPAYNTGRQRNSYDRLGTSGLFDYDDSRDDE